MPTHPGNTTMAFHLDFLQDDAEMHFREEYSTYDWVMDGLLTRAGFAIDDKQLQDGVLGIYLCSR